MCMITKRDDMIKFYKRESGTHILQGGRPMKDVSPVLMIVWTCFFTVIDDIQAGNSHNRP